VRELSAVAVRILGLLATSASVKPVFSVGPWLCADYRPSTKLAEPLLQEMCAMTT
jgi:hypothetical protein